MKWGTSSAGGVGGLCLANGRTMTHVIADVGSGAFCLLRSHRRRMGAVVCPLLRRNVDFMKWVVRGYGHIFSCVPGR